MVIVKRIGILIVLAAAVWLGNRYFFYDDPEAGPPRNRRGDATRPIPVETAPVRRATVRDKAGFSGTLTPRAEFTVAPRISGRLQALSVDIGDIVTNGQLISVLDDEEYARQLEQAHAERDVAQATLAESISAYEIATRDLNRFLSLHEQGVVSDTELDAAQSKYDAAAARRNVAEAQRGQREAALAAARVRLAYTRIHAGWEDKAPTRVVGERHVHEGAMLSAGQAIVSILDIHQLTAVLHVVERDYPRIAVGQTAHVIADARPGETVTGTVTRVAPRIDERSRQARVEIVLDNHEQKLRPGMFVRAEIVFAVTEDACVVPAEAVTRRAGQTGVFVVDPDTATAVFVPVTIGVSDREVIQILDPSLSGRVITLGQHLLDDGSAVRLENGL